MAGGAALSILLMGCGQSTPVALPPTTTTALTPNVEPPGEVSTLAITPTLPPTTAQPGVTTTLLKAVPPTTLGAVTSTSVATAAGTTSVPTSTVPTSTVPTSTVPTSAVTPTTGTPTTVTPTTSGTSTTTTQPRISGFLAQSASFVTADSGFVLGVVGCPKRVCLALRHTADRGAIWHAAKPPPTTIDTSGASGVSGLEFADPRNGWAFGPSLWVTHNGALSWTRVRMAGTVDEVASGAGVVYALVDTCGGSSACRAPERLMRSPVGRNAWAPVAGPFGRYARGTLSLVVEGGTVFVLSVGTTSEITSSTGGTHFVALPAPCAPPPAGYVGPLAPSSLAASGPTNVAVACVGDPAAGSSLKQAFISSDGGHTYQRLPDPPTGGDGAVLTMPTPTTLLLQASSATSRVERIAAPDRAWTTSVDFADGGVGTSDLTFVNPLDGALIDGPAANALPDLGSAGSAAHLGQLYLTDDGGATWRPTVIPG